MAHIVFRGAAIAYLIRGAATDVTMPISKDGVAATVTSATVTPYKADGTALSAEAVTIAGGVPSVSPNISASESYGDGWWLEWACSDSSGPLPVHRQPVVLCAREPLPTYGHLDVLDERPNLTDYPTGQTTWTPQCREAWEELLATLVECTGHRLDEVLTWPQTRRCLRHLCHAHIHAARATYTGSTSARQRDAAQDAYEDAFQALRLKLDTDDDGVSEDEFSGARIEWPGRSGRRVS